MAGKVLTLEERIARLESRLEGLTADYDIHSHDPKEVNGLRDRIAALEELQKRVEALEAIKRATGWQL